MAESYTPNNNNTDWQEWLVKAHEDEVAGERILKDGWPFAPACFHFQQMAEKLLKGLLILSGKEFPKTHDLTVLATITESELPQVENLKENLKLLNRYYIETRYPGDYPEFTLKDAQEALNAVLKVKEFVEENIKKYDS